MALILATGQLPAKIIFVSAGATGNGSSWPAAMGSLQDALSAAMAGDQIWVARGTYRTTEDNDRSRSFVIPAGIELYGGFAGFESSPEQRNLADNPTYLSGEIGSSSYQDNAFTVVYTKNAGGNTVIDGFFITGGAANGSDKSRPMEIRGAGWYNLATDGQSSSPLIRNCTVTGNYAREGAGIFNLAVNKGQCQPGIINCSFIGNKADLDGGALLNTSMGGSCGPRVINCLFESNLASYGAAIFNEPRQGGSVTPFIKGCTFRKNKAYVRSGSIHNEYTGNGSCQPTLEENHFEGNAASVGQEKNSPSITDEKRNDNDPSSGEDK